MSTSIEGPAWARAGLHQSSGRFPLAIETPVSGTVGRLLPGVTTQTRWARYYTLYWAIAGETERRGLDVVGCRQLVRRAELLLACVSLALDPPDARAHAVDRVARSKVGAGGMWELAEVGAGSYSPREWGFSAQYSGSCELVGLLRSDGGTLQPGRHPCPEAVREAFAPLLRAVQARSHFDDGLIASCQHLAISATEGAADIAALRGPFTAEGDPESRLPVDQIRRAAIRIVLRSRMLAPPELSSVDAVRWTVAYGARLVEDPVLANEPLGAHWRGMLLRHHSVGAWRRLWAALVDRIGDSDTGWATRGDLHAWVESQLPATPLASFLDKLPPTTGSDGHPYDAEAEVRREPGVIGDLAVLVLGAQRLDELTGETRRAFLNPRRTKEFLDPQWVGRRVVDVAGGHVGDLGRALVDDMLAQARRVGLRKMRVRDGQLRTFSRLHERDGRFVALSREGSTNVGTRIYELGDMAVQLGLFHVQTEGRTTLSAAGDDLVWGS